MGSIPVIELDLSDPVKRGEIYGEAARGQIKMLLEIYKRIFAEHTEFTWDKIKSMLDPYVVKTNSFAPDLMEEVQGIAAGANLPFIDIFALNARSEIMYDLQIYTDECSALAALPGATRNNSTILAQNWDWDKEIESCQVILKLHQRENIPSIVTFTEAGQISKLGMNSAGIGLVVNTLSADRSRVGIPWIFLSRRVLESSRFTQAMGYILGSPKGHSMNFLIAHKDGEAVDIETSCVENHVIFPKDNVMAHTNHYIEHCKSFKDNKTCACNPSTFNRFNRLTKLLGQMNGNIDTQAVHEILKDHFDHPFSVCLHNSNDFFPAILTSKTCLSIVMDLSNNLLEYTKGNPCRNAVESFDLTTF